MPWLLTSIITFSESYKLALIMLDFFPCLSNTRLQVQAESTVHADGLVAVSKKLESLDQDIEDTRGLLAELQGEKRQQFGIHN